MFKNLATILFSAFSCLVSLSYLIALQFWNKKEKKFKQALDDANLFDNPAPFVSVLVPARNEEAEIKDCLTSILEQDYPSFEVLAMDDHSTDRTPQIMSELATAYPDHLHIISVTPPQSNWLGKQNALWQGYLQIDPQAEWLLFVDADTVLKPGILRAALNYSVQQQIDLFSLMPEVLPKDLWFSLLNPEVLQYYALANFKLKADPTTTALASGAFSLVRRSAYAAVDGHRAVRNLVRSDVILAQLLCANHFTTFFEEGDGYVNLKPYVGLWDYWSSISRSLFLKINKSWSKTGLILSLQWLHGLLPFMLLLRQLNTKDKARNYQTALTMNLTAVTLIFVLQSRINYTLHISPFYALLYPVSGLLSTALFLDSAYRTTFGKEVKWKGRDVNIAQN